ncbi:MAG: AAA family ATPase, partial [Methanothrix sp.]|nr:AAA family ATPase [Methanothrix sp.]
MLLEFSLSNFLSIKDEITLSMIASTDKLLDKNTIKYNKITLLKSAAIYGPNASGKTNILHALYYITHLIINSHRIQSGETLDYRPFKLDNKYETKPSDFKIVFEIDSIKYIYEFSLDKD